ncbi:MAG TPA: acyl-ACP--UDP-N-acetylglucosamine O-acyltransferase [Vicinamibacteria bacterium]|nr:acyl-ACP--UDP-N-acetylglucosamine O-acyltransferase [Vicinamibacteria bacterium]
MIDIGRLVQQIPTHYPFVLLDRVVEHDRSRGLVAVKAVTGSEDFFEGHFPGAPVRPGVLIMECLAQAAGVWLLDKAGDPRRLEVVVVGIDDAKFRRPVVPGDLLRLEVGLLHRRGDLCRFEGVVRVADSRVAEARLLLQVRESPAALVDATARVAPGAVLGKGVRIGPYAVVGPEVRIGARSVIDAHAVIEGDTELGEDNRVFSFASVGRVPQDLKFRGEHSVLRIGHRNVVRECVTIHVGTRGGGGITSIGDDNLLMAYAHVAHDCRVGNHTILANGATLAGHVVVEDHATVGAYSGIHQFCRVGRHSFVGGFTVATKDVLPFSKTVGNRACIYGLNVVGLRRRGFSPETIAALRQAYRTLLQSRLNTSEAVRHLEAEGAAAVPEVRTLVEFIRTSRRGVVLRRRGRLADDEGEEE